MKASQLASLMNGTRAVRRVPLPLAVEGRTLGVPMGAAEGAAPSSFQAPEVGIRALTDAEKMAALQRAAEITLQHKGKPEDGNPIYDVALRACTLAIACVDPDDPAHPPFFDSAEQIQSSTLLCGDSTALLYEHYLLQANVVNPGLEQLGPEQLDHIIKEGAGPHGADFFLRLPLIMQMSLWLFMANQLANSREHSSPSGSDSTSDGRSESPTPASDA